MIKHIDHLAEDWAEIIQGILERSCIAYPNASTIARINEGGSMVAGSKCPEVMLKQRISQFDMVYKGMRNSWRKVIVKKYIIREKLTRKEQYILSVLHEYIADEIIKIKSLKCAPENA